MKLRSQEASFKRKRLAVMISAMMVGQGAIQLSHAQEVGEADDATETEEYTELEEVIVTGIRGSLQNARDIKRNADTFVDSISSSDVSALPDLSVAEALQRVPGVTVTRIELGGSEGDFPSPEGSGNLIRGLGFVRSEFNGRDAFSANGGRALDWSSVPPELVGGVDVYKNQSADLIEGGISGSINLKTLNPFDREGAVAVVALDGTYTDLREEVSPQLSGTFGNRWELESGAEVGLLGSLSSSELQSGINGFQAGHLGAFGIEDGRTIAAPIGFQLRTNETDRDRESAYLAGQFRNADGNFEATAKYVRVNNEIDSFERTSEYFAEGGTIGSFQVVGTPSIVPFSSSGLALCANAEPTPGACEVTTPVSDGLFESGMITNASEAWYGAAGAPLTNLAIANFNESTTEDLSLNLKWDVNDRLNLSFDAHYTEASSLSTTLWGGTRTFTDIGLVVDSDNPVVNLTVNPNNNLTALQNSNLPTGTNLADPNGSFLLFAADAFTEGEGDLYAVRADGDYAFEDAGWFESVKFGARLSERNQVNREAALNWAAVAPPWAGGLASYSDLPDFASETVDFTDFFRGGVVTGDNSGLVFTNQALLTDYDAFAEFVGTSTAFTNADWSPQRVNGVVDYADDEVSDIEEEVQNLYVRFDLAKDFENGTSLTGNFGVRYVKTDVNSTGFRNFDEFSEDVQEPGRSPALEAIDNLRDFIPEAAAFYDQESTNLTLNQSEDYWLPSLNLKYNLDDEKLIRFGISKAITLPNIQDIRAAQTVRQAATIISPEALDPTDPNFGTVQGFAGITLNDQIINGGNPNLKATEAVNVDLSFEYYFGDSNSLTASLFYKDLSNSIIFGQETVGEIVLDGQSVTQTYIGLINQDEAEIKGVELAYQQFFDHLPGWYSNLGVQMNYTYVDAKAPPPPAFLDANNDGVIDDGSFENTFRYGIDDVLGQSEHTANLVGIYQDDKVEFRIAYNWRSEYLSSYRDFITGNPIFQESAGFVDASFKYDFTDNFQFRVSAANILDTKSKAFQQIDADGQTYDRSSFLNDRRIVFGLRYQY